MPARLLHVLAPDSSTSRSRPGVGRPRRPARRSRPGSRFRIASVTKPFVAAAALRLVEDGRLSLDATVADAAAGRVRRAAPRSVATTPRDHAAAPAHPHERHLRLRGRRLRPRRSPTGSRPRSTRTRRRWTRLEQIGFAVSHGAPYGAAGPRFGYSRHRRLPRRRGARADDRRHDGCARSASSSGTSGSGSTHLAGDGRAEHRPTCRRCRISTRASTTSPTWTRRSTCTAEAG